MLITRKLRYNGNSESTVIILLFLMVRYLFDMENQDFEGFSSKMCKEYKINDIKDNQALGSFYLKDVLILLTKKSK